MNVFLRWWLFACLMLAASIVVGFHNGYHRLYADDPTMMCFLILGIFALVSGYIGMLSWKFDRNIYDTEVLKKLSVSLNTGWLSASLFTKLGMLGTIIGFVMSVASFKNLDTTNPAASQLVIQDISVGISVALYTTLVGLVCNMLMMLQNFNLAQAIQHRLRETEVKDVTSP